MFFCKQGSHIASSSDTLLSLSRVEERLSPLSSHGGQKRLIGFRRSRRRGCSEAVGIHTTVSPSHPPTLCQVNSPATVVYDSPALRLNRNGVPCLDYKGLILFLHRIATDEFVLVLRLTWMNHVQNSESSS